MDKENLSFKFCNGTFAKKFAAPFRKDFTKVILAEKPQQ
jgi:hypothetical protein